MKLYNSGDKSFKDIDTKKHVRAIAMAVALTIPWAAGIGAIVKDRMDLERKNQEIFGNSNQVSSNYEEAKPYGFVIEVLSPKEDGQVDSHILSENGAFALYDEQKGEVVILGNMEDGFSNAVNIKTGENADIHDFGGCPTFDLFEIVQNNEVVSVQTGDNKYTVDETDLENAVLEKYNQRFANTNTNTL